MSLEAKALTCERGSPQHNGEGHSQINGCPLSPVKKVRVGAHLKALEENQHIITHTHTQGFPRNQTVVYHQINSESCLSHFIF